MNKFIRFIPAVLLALYLVVKIASHIPSPSPGPEEYEPTVTQKELLLPVKESLSDYPEAANDFESLYYGMALVVGSDEVILKTTGDVRRAHENAGTLAVQAGEIPSIPGYAEAVNDFIVAEVGRDNVPLDAVKRKQIVDTFKALAWATN